VIEYHDSVRPDPDGNGVQRYGVGDNDEGG